jgi:hypothetical protein
VLSGGIELITTTQAGAGVAVHRLSPSVSIVVTIVDSVTIGVAAGRQI